ncbi:hypothetical protein L1987_08899 [Smallanthus sonchifolius]|uniref:Uncharacterized protein n=1 Tax=Smallanthus sonchifolius TaxID=185202 RepID=A0ACB9JLF9_9ASTR|nr:hypothetical protein L1987_08899 [Smallanthus sonchifolius]
MIVLTADSCIGLGDLGVHGIGIPTRETRHVDGMDAFAVKQACKGTCFKEWTHYSGNGHLQISLLGGTQHFTFNFASPAKAIDFSVGGKLSVITTDPFRVCLLLFSYQLSDSSVLDRLIRSVLHLGIKGKV